MPMSAMVRILGCRTRRSSIPLTGTFSPPRMMMSFTRAVMRMNPSASIRARSPVVNHPSAV